MSNKEIVFVVGSHGFSDKRIKIESLKNNSEITVDEETLNNYLNRQSSQDIISELEQEKKSNISIVRKPVVRYKPHKENPSVGTSLSRSTINHLYNRRIMQNQKKINAPQVRYVIESFLSGQTFTYESLQKHILERADKEIKLQPLQACVSSIKHSKIGFLLKKVGRVPAHFQMDKRAMEIKGEDLYQMFLPRGALDIEQACNKYPFIREILREQGIVDFAQLEKKTEKTDQKNTKEENKKAAATDELPLDRNASDGPAEIIPGKNPLKSLIAGTSVDTMLSKGKFDINVNFNFRILFK